MSNTARKIDAVVREDITVHIDKTLVPDAAALGLDVTAIVEHSLAEALAAEKGKRWAEESAEAIRSSNDYVEKHGLPLAKYRMF